MTNASINQTNWKQEMNNNNMQMPNVDIVFEKLVTESFSN